MNIDANTPERDEFDGDPLNPKHIEAVCGYLKNSPRDNLKKQALEIIEALKEKNMELYLRGEHYKDQSDAFADMYHTLLEKKVTEKQSFVSRIVLWFKGK